MVSVSTIVNQIKNKSSNYDDLEEALDGFSDGQIRDLINDIDKARGDMDLGRAVNHFIDKVDKNDNGISENDIKRYYNLLRDDVSIGNGGKNDIFKLSVIKSVFDSAPSGNDRGSSGGSSRISGSTGGSIVKMEHKENGTFESGYKRINNDVEIQYITAPNRYEQKNFPTKGADYMIIVSSSGGHDKGSYRAHSGVNPDILKIPENLKDRVVGWVGSQDKCMILINTRGINSFNFEGKNETELIRLKTGGKELRLDNKATGKQGTSGSDIKGALDPEIRKEHVKADGGDSNDFSIYAEDEGRNQKRLDTLAEKAKVGFDGGDNSLFVFNPNTEVNLNGNGAIANISVV